MESDALALAKRMTHEADLGEDGSFYLIIWKHVHRVCNQVAHKLTKLLSCWL